MTDAAQSAEPQWLADLPRTTFAHLPTPLEPLDRLSAEIGGPRIWLKRDDCTGLATGGNKTRKLEYLLAQAIDDKITDVVTFGAVQSNHARQTAAACARLGLRCHLLLAKRVAWSHRAYESAGNVLLDELFGAEVTLLEADEVANFSRAYIGNLKSTGKPLVIPAGGSNATGALGYVRCAYELAQQVSQLGLSVRHVAHASSSAGTQAGLAYGLAKLASPMSTFGINVYHEDGNVLEADVAQLVAELEERLGSVGPITANYDHRYLGEGYGIPTDLTRQALRMAAQFEGVVFDPVYSGKALGALIDLLSVGELAEAPDLIFVHTGGSAALAVYDNAF